MGWREHRSAPARGTLLCRTDALVEGGCKELRFGEGDGACSLLLHRRGCVVHGYVNSCPHFSLPLNAQPAKFLLLSDHRVMCAWHCAMFRLDDGLCVEGPAQGMSLEAVPLIVRGEYVYLGDA